MAFLTPVQVKITGTKITKVAASAGGDTFAPGDVKLVVVNGDASPHTVTIAVPGNTKYGQAQPDIAQTIPAGEEWEFGPFPVDLADPADGVVHVTYDAVTSVTVALKRG